MSKFKKEYIKSSSPIKETILILSPCRSGSTALLNAFAMSGKTSVFQPIKASIRHGIVGKPKTIKIENDSADIVIKEALGPYFKEEINYSPLSLIKSQLKPKTIKLISLLRNPDLCFASWQKAFSNKNSSGLFFSASIFNQATAIILNTHLEAISSGIPAIALKSEDLSDKDYLSLALESIGIEASDEMFNWQSSPHYQQGSYSFIKPKEPPQFKVKGLLDGIKYGTALSSKALSQNQITTVSQDIEATRDSYKKFTHLCFEL